MIRSFLSLTFVILSSLLSSVLTASPPPGSVPWGVGGKWKQWHQPCTKETTQVRQDFDKMAPEDRKAYTDAVKCLMKKPSKLNSTLYPGAINRFFDYSAIHTSRTKSIHLNGFFLTWHRMFIWLYEQDLKHTCGYKGTQPYWNWPATANDLKGSAVFDGSQYSMSGDGKHVDTGPVVLSPTFSLPHGSGGGCVTTGPFANMNYTMASIPISVILKNEPLPPTAFDHRPTCLTRDLNTYVAKTQTNVTQWNAAVHAPDAATFSLLLNGVLGGGQLGLHSGAHFIVGSPASSLFVSPQDPIWYPLHAMLDYTYWTWQRNNPKVAHALHGTETATNLPPSANVTLESVGPDWDYLFPALKVKELMNTTAGPFCYIYA